MMVFLSVEDVLEIHAQLIGAMDRPRSLRSNSPAATSPA
jgi:hypothetical protein